MRVKNLIKIVLFSVIFLMVINHVYRILSWKDTSGGYRSSVNSLYELDEDMADVMFFGTSRCYCSVDPSYLWEKYGISSFNMAISGQDIIATYYTMKEAFKTQSPDVVFVEMYGTLFDGYAVEGNVYRNTLPFRFSANAYHLAMNAIPEKYDKKSIFLKWPIIHTRYKELQKDDFQSEMSAFLGFVPNFYKAQAAEGEIYEGTERIPMPEEREKWFREIIQLAQENGAELYFFVAPYERRIADQKTLLYAEDIAEEYGVSVLNLVKDGDKLNINYGEDFCDWAHTNYWGAQKVTKYIGNYINANYDLEDHRGDERYAVWDENSVVCKHEVQNYQLKQMNNISGYLELLSCMEDYVVVVSAAGAYRANDMDISEFLMAIGIGEEFNSGNGGVWVIDNGECIYQSVDSDSFYHMDLQYSDMVISRTGGANFIWLDHVNHNRAGDGLDILVFDKVLGTVADSVGFYAPENYKVVR